MKEAQTPGQEEDTEQEATCIGHHIDKRSNVHMVLKWKDDPDDSLGKVGKIMAAVEECKAFGNTWWYYCNEKGITDEVF